MVEQDTEVETVDNQKPKISFPGLISRVVDVGGAGGLIKIFLSILVWFYLFFFQERLDVLIWNTMILNVPCLIDIFEFKVVPSNVPTEIFHRFRGWLILLLIIAILFSLFLWGGSANVENFNFDNAIFKFILKVFISLNIVGTGFCYAGKVYTENSRIKLAEDSESNF